jgi:hypothetical protein
MATVLLFAFSGAAFAEDIRNFYAKLDTFSKENQKTIGHYIDHFIEQGIINVKKDEFTAPDAACKLIRFAIYDTVINSRGDDSIQNCQIEGCDKDMLFVESSFVSTIIKAATGIDFTEHVTCAAENPPLIYDGLNYRFKGAFKKPVWYAKVGNAEKLPSGEIFVTGYILSIKDPTESHGTFEALVRPNNLQSTHSLALISLESKLYK